MKPILSSFQAITVGPNGRRADFATSGLKDDLVINAAIKQASATKKSRVHIMSGVYHINAPITLLDGVSLSGEGGGATKLIVGDAFPNTNYYVVGCLGGESGAASGVGGTSIPLTVDALQGTSTLTFAASTEAAKIVVGDNVFLKSEALWEATNLSGRKIGEFVEVLAVTATTITTSSYLRDDYLTSQTAELVRIDFVQNIEISGIDFSQSAALDTKTGNPPGLIGLARVRTVHIHDCIFHNYDGPAITVLHGIDVSVTDNIIRRLTSNSAQSRLGYGCLIGGASERVVIANNRIGRCRHGIDSGPSKAPAYFKTTNYGIPRAVVASSNALTKCADAALSTHSEAEGWIFANNVITNCNAAAINMRGRGCHILNNSIEWCSQGINIGNPLFESQGGSGSGCHVIGNSIRNMRALPSFGGLGVGITVSLTDKVVVKQNAISACDRSGIQLRAGVTHSVFTGNTIVDCNLANANNLVSDGISIDTGKSGNGTIAPDAGAAPGTAILTRAAGAFTEPQNGRYVVISASPTAANNGRFLITQILSTGAFRYDNAAAVVDDSLTAVYQIENSSDNVFQGNVFMNNPASRYSRQNNVGNIQSGIRDYGQVNNNLRNVYKDNCVTRMKTAGATGIIRTSVVGAVQINNLDIT